MLLEFSLKNYRSFKDKTTFSMIACSGKENIPNVFVKDDISVLKSAAIFGPNASGKSNFIKGLATSINFIRNCIFYQRNDPIPMMDSFAFDDVCVQKPSEFEYIFIAKDNKKYIYNFSCNHKRVITEKLIKYASQRPTVLFERNNEEYNFYQRETKAQFNLIKDNNSENKLFLSTAAQLNCKSVIDAFDWFSQCINVWEPGHPANIDFTIKLLESDEKHKFLDFANRLLNDADINIENINFDENKIPLVPNGGLKESGVSEWILNSNNKSYSITTTHKIKNNDLYKNYNLSFVHESRGTQTLFWFAGYLYTAFKYGMCVAIDEFGTCFHPELAKLLIKLFSNQDINRNNAQFIIASHILELLDLTILRRDQIYLIEKNSEGSSDLYSLDDYSVRQNENIYKNYMYGRYGAFPNVVI